MSCNLDIVASALTDSKIPYEIRGEGSSEQTIIIPPLENLCTIKDSKTSHMLIKKNFIRIYWHNNTTPYQCNISAYTNITVHDAVSMALRYWYEHNEY